MIALNLNHASPDADPPHHPGADLVDAHQEFVRGIDDRARLGYSLLGIGTVVVVVVLLVVTWTSPISWRGLLLVGGGGLVTLIVGRIFALARWEAILKRRVETYCRHHEIEVDQLVSEAIREGRFEFFVKLFIRVARPSDRPS